MALCLCRLCLQLPCRQALHCIACLSNHRACRLQWPHTAGSASPPPGPSAATHTLSALLVVEEAPVARCTHLPMPEERGAACSTASRRARAASRQRWHHRVCTIKAPQRRFCSAAAASRRLPSPNWLLYARLNKCIFNFACVKEILRLCLAVRVVSCTGRCVFDALGDEERAQLAQRVWVRKRAAQVRQAGGSTHQKAAPRGGGVTPGVADAQAYTAEQPPAAGGKRSRAFQKRGVTPATRGGAQAPPPKELARTGLGHILRRSVAPACCSREPEGQCRCRPPPRLRLGRQSREANLRARRPSPAAGPGAAVRPAWATHCFFPGTVFRRSGSPTGHRRWDGPIVSSTLAGRGPSNPGLHAGSACRGRPLAPERA